MRIIKVTLAAIFFVHVSVLGFAKTIIKQETLNFEGCTKVMAMTTEKLGSSPKLTEDTENKKVAEYYSHDGTVIIECDRALNQVTVYVK